MPRIKARTYLRNHGLSGTPEYSVWRGMIERCENPKASGFRNYGGRGIRICPSWRKHFQAFFEDMGPRPSPAHKLDRIDVNGDYTPGNCRWATGEIESSNRRGCFRIERTHEGKRLTIRE